MKVAAASVELGQTTPMTLSDHWPLFELQIRTPSLELRTPTDADLAELVELVRTFTPLRVDNDAGRMDLEIVRHDKGAVSGWAETVSPGEPAAVNGPGRGFELPDGTTRLLLLGDETALPAVAQLMEWMPPEVEIEAHVEVVADDAVVGMPDDDAVTWHVSDPPGAALAEMARSLTADDLPDTTHLWAAGGASAVQAIRSHLFDDLGFARSRATVRGYWKPRDRS